MVKGVLFDFDGVIAYSKHIHFASWQFAVNEVLDATVVITSGDIKSGASPIIISEILCEKFGSHSQAEELLTVKNNYLTEHIDEVEHYNGVGKLFEYLKKRNIPYGDYVNPKPNPEPYLKLANSLNIKPADFKDVYIFEDSELGLQAALNSGMKSVYIQSHCVVSENIISQTNYQFNSLFDAMGTIDKLIAP
jgi:beta-phosphoglucomutase